MTVVNNIFECIPSLVEGENFSQLLQCANLKIERIISSDRPDKTIYNQPQDEWVILLKGEAELKIDDKLLKLKSGDLFVYSLSHSSSSHENIC